MSTEVPSLIRATELAQLPELALRHPLNPNSEVHVRLLSDLAGLSRLGFSMARVPPGRESFVYHYHHFEEEFIYILSGRGIAEIGDAEHEVGPGDIMLFTAPSVGHHLRNPFLEDLVYLMGGERCRFEIGEFPRLRKRAIFDRSGAAPGPYLIDVDSTQPFEPRLK